MAAEWHLVEAARAGEVTLDGLRRIVTPFDIRDAFFDPSKRQKMQSSKLLAIDDLGSEGRMHEDAFTWCLDDLINFRWRHEKTTIITTNLGGRDLLRRYGRRTTDRIRDHSRCVSVKGKNYRS